MELNPTAAFHQRGPLKALGCTGLILCAPKSGMDVFWKQSELCPVSVRCVHGLCTDVKAEAVSEQCCRVVLGKHCFPFHVKAQAQCHLLEIPSTANTK